MSPHPPILEPQPPLDARAVREFVDNRRTFPWFGHALTIRFVDGLAKATQGSREVLVYHFGTLPMTGRPLMRGSQAREHTMLEVRDPSWSLRFGHVAPREQRFGILAWLGPREVRIDDPTFSGRFKAFGLDATTLLTPTMRSALLSAAPSTSLAWAGERVMVERPGRLVGEANDELVTEGLALVETLTRAQV